MTAGCVGTPNAYPPAPGDLATVSSEEETP